MVLGVEPARLVRAERHVDGVVPVPDPAAEPDGSLLIADRAMTGFTWREEQLAGVDKLVPYNAEEQATEHGARYEKTKLPFGSYAVIDGNLVTGQNPGSAEKVAALLGTR